MMSIISFGSIIAIVIYTLQVLEQSSQKNLKERIATALDVEQLHLNKILLEYSYWDEAYNKLIKIPNNQIDFEWVNQNIGQYVYDEHAVDIVIVGSSPTQVKLGFFEGEPFEYDSAELIKHGLGVLINANLQESPSPLHFFKYHNRFYLVGLNEFWDEESSEPVGDGSFILFGKVVSDTFLEKLAALYKLPPLGSVDDSNLLESNNYLSVVSTYKDDKFYISWPGVSLTEYKKAILLIVIFMGALQLLFVFYIFKKQNKNQLEQQQALQEMASKDYLTGILNRRAFIEKASEFMDKRSFTKQEFCLMMLDLDDFKIINDTFGHQVGDEVLKRVTETVNSIIKEQDIFARFGGEEFILLLSSCSLDYSKEIADRILKQVEDIEIEGVTNISKKLSVSIGMSHFQKSSELDNLIAKADKAMYEAKSMGKNQFVIA